jgi:hypothetical protein
MRREVVLPGVTDPKDRGAYRSTVADTPYPVVASRLTAEVRVLFLQMVDLHTANPAASYRFFQLVESFSGAGLVWSGDGQITAAVSSSIVNDLAELGLIRYAAGGGRDRRIEVRSQAVDFAKWLRREGGPVVAVEREVMRLVDDDAFKFRHPARHLADAQSGLWSEDPTVNATIIDIGNHLRAALQAVVHDVAGGSDPEEPIANLTTWVDGLAEKREGELLVEVVRYALRCANRLTHIRNEVAGRGRPPIRGVDEVRRTVFLVTVVCNEIDGLAGEAP